jgi:hypothetical protein
VRVSGDATEILSQLLTNPVLDQRPALLGAENDVVQVLRESVAHGVPHMMQKDGSFAPCGG